MEHKLKVGKFVNKDDLFRNRVKEALSTLPDGEWITKDELGEMINVSSVSIKNRIKLYEENSRLAICDVAGIVAERRVFANERTVKAWRDSQKKN